MPPADLYTLAGEPYDGHALRVVAGHEGGPVVEIRPPGGAIWSAAPLRHLAQLYPVGAGPWPWLRERHIRRPSPSGRSTPEAERERRGLTIRLTDDERAELEALAERWGVGLSDAVVRLIRQAR